MKLGILDNRVRIWGAVSVEETKDGCRIWRLPYERKELYFVTLAEMLGMTAGVKISFISDTKTIRVNGIKLEERKECGFDLYFDGVKIATKKFEDKSFVEFKVPSEEKGLCEIWLPQTNAFAYESIEVDDGCQLEFDERNLKKWITYGSSITHATEAECPSFTWPAIVARDNHLDLTCFGVSGQCHLDILMAKQIRDREADVISLCAGINIWGASSLGQRSFAPSLIGFIDVIREKHPQTPIIVCSPIYGYHREAQMNAVEFNLVLMRSVIKDTIEKLNNLGDKNLYYVDGLKLISEAEKKFLPDELHPGAEGYKVLAKNFQIEVVEKYFYLNPSI